MRIGIDIGGSKIEILALAADGSQRIRRRIPTPGTDYDQVLRATTGLVQEVEAELGQTCPVGVGIPGAISPATGLIKNANSTCLIGHPMDKDLAEALGRPVRLENDANCFALSEATDGAARDGRVVFGAILGTGVGGGLVIQGRLLRGANAIAGEWGHSPLPWPQDDERPGRPCYCGKQGCAETVLSGPGLAADYGSAAGQDRSAIDVARLAAQGDAAARDALGRYCDRLARALAAVINIVDPDVIVLGGGLSNIDSLYRELPARLPAYVFSDEVATRVVPPRHGDSSGVRGAAWLWPDPEETGQ